MDRGTYLEHDGLPAVRFQRIYPHPIERGTILIFDTGVTVLCGVSSGRGS